MGASSDPEDEPLHIDADSLSVAGGNLTLVDDGASAGSRSWTYDPVDDFAGDIVLTFDVTDGVITLPLQQQLL